MQRVKFYLGEDKYVRFRVHSVNDEEFVISNATWSLQNQGIEESKGSCAIDGSAIGARIAPKEKAQYYLEITYQIADETLIEKAEVQVM